MEYVFDFQFFIKEAIFSSDSYTEDFPAVGIRLLNYPSVIIYPSNEGNTLKTMKRYPKGKCCSFAMTINRLVHLLSKAIFPIQLYIIEHSAACPATVTMQGFVNDQTLPKQLTTLCSLPSKMERQIKFSKKIFYNKTTVVPVFKDSKFPVGSVTLKITVKIKNKNPADGHNNSYHSSGQLDSFLDPLQSASVGVVKQRAAEYLPNVWLPPPLTFTCSKVKDNIPAVAIDETPTVINKTDQSSKHAANIASLFPVDDGHWSAIMQCNDSSFPWKGAVLTKCSHTVVQDKKISNDPKSPIERLSENEKINFKEYPYLSGLYKELMLLHDNNTALAETNPPQTVRDIRSQSVQTDPLRFDVGQDQHNHSPSVEHTAMCPHHDDDLDSEELINAARQHNDHTKTSSLQMSRHNTTSMRNNSYNSLNSSEMSFEQTGTFSNDRHVDSQQPIKEVDCNLLQTTDKDNSNNLEQQMSPNSLSSSDIETSRPFIPILTISQASSMCIPQTHDHAAKLNQFASATLRLPLPSSTNTLHPSEQHPSTSLQVFQSTESALGTLSGAVSNEVKCGNQCLEQKIYLASSMQSIDRDTLSSQHNNEADNSNNSVTHYEKVTYGAATTDNRHGNGSSSNNTVSDSSNTISDSSTYVTSLITDDHVIEELEIESDYYDNYSEDFESDNDN